MGNHKIIHQSPLHPLKVTGRCAIWLEGIVRLYFFIHYEINEMQREICETLMNNLFKRGSNLANRGRYLSDIIFHI